MAVRLRMTRLGKRNRPFYRIGAYDARTRRDGKCLEILGTYDPLKKDDISTLNQERIEYWLSVGAKPSETVSSIIKKHKMQSK